VNAPECDIQVEQSPEGLRAASEVMRRFAVDHGIPESVANRLDVALEEILSNVLRHAFRRPLSDRPDLQLRLDVLGNALRATVIDNGPAFDPVRFEPTPVATSLAESELGGWGIRLAREMVDEIRYRRADERNCLELVVRSASQP
jgi:anti-sigma regulatory factor (Ser/Thr protein kinase)